jgi:tetratricopeptide (TPR) repeat protein
MSAQNQTMTTVTQAKAHHELKQYIKAVELLENFLNTKPASNVYLPSVHYNLGRIYFSIGNLDKAEKNLVNALALCKEYDITSEITALCHSKLSDVYAAQKNADAAAKEFKEALKFYEKEYKGKLQYSKEYLSCMNNMASFLHNAGRTQDAFILQQKIVSLLEDNDNDYLPFKSVKAQVFQNYGNTCSDLGKNDEAEKYYNMALEICESTMDSDKARTPDSIRLKADILFSRGNNYGKLNKNDLAEKDYLASAQLFHEIGEKTGLPAYFLQESKPLNNLASLLSNQKRYEEAEKVYADVIRLREENAKNDSDRLQLAKAIFNYAHALMQKDDDGEKAFNMFEKGLKISRELGDDVLTARFLTFCAICSDNDEVGKKHYAEAWRLLEKHPDDPNADVIRKILDSIKQHFTDDEK